MKYEQFILAIFFASVALTAKAATSAEQATTRLIVSNYAKTKYPIVFNHGMAGFISIGTDQFGLDYFIRFCQIWHVMEQIRGQPGCHL